MVNGNADILALAAFFHINIQAAQGPLSFCLSLLKIELLEFITYLISSQHSGKFEYCCPELQSFAFLDASIGQTNASKSKCGQRKGVFLLGVMFPCLGRHVGARSNASFVTLCSYIPIWMQDEWPRKQTRKVIGYIPQWLDQT